MLDVSTPVTEEPQPLEGAARSIEAISGSGVHTCAVSEGAAYCWGDNAARQSAEIDADRVAPALVPGGEWQSIVAAVSHSCALDRAGAVYCWGDNALGQLGQGDRVPASGPVRVQLPSAAIQLTGGFQHSCVVLDSSELYCWGDGSEGQIGRGDSFPGDGSRDADALLPEPVALPDGVLDGWSSVDAGEGHTCALRTDGSLWCWGRNSQRQLGTASVEGQLREPARIGADADWQSVDAALAHSCALKSDGSLWCWGYNMGSMSASGNPLGVSCPQPADCMQLDQPTRVAQGPWRAFRTHVFHTCALAPDAQLWCWGRNHEGQLARENPVDPLDPSATLNVHLQTLVATGVTEFGLGRFTTCAAAEGGAMRCAGKNDRGQLGVGVGLSQSDFVEVPLPRALPVEGL